MAWPISLLTLGVITASVMVLVVFVRAAALPKPLPGIPYKAISAHRILGDGPDLMKWEADNGDRCGYFAYLATELKSPVFQVFMRPFGKPFVVVMDPREIYDIMTRRLKDFDRSNFFGEIFEALLPKFHMHMPTGPEWQANRRLVSDLMSPAFLHDVAGPQMWTTTQTLISLWREKVRLAKGGSFRIDHDMHKGALDIMWAATFGEEIGSTKAQLAYLSGMSDIQRSPNLDTAIPFKETEDPPAYTAIMTLTQSMDITVSSLFPRLHHWLALNLYPRLVAARRHKDTMIQSRLEEAKVRLASKSVKDVEAMTGLKSALDLLVIKEMKMAVKEGRPAKCDSQQIQDELFGFLVAGHETTSTTVLWTIKTLTEQVDIQGKLRSALETQFKEAKEQKRQPIIEEITSAQVAYLDAVIEEIGRHGLATAAKIRIALQNVDVLGYSIPAGTDVFLMNNGPGYVMDTIEVDENKRSKSSQNAKEKTPDWDPEGIEAYKPERWLVKGEDGRDAFNPNAGPSIPFGVGPRGCYGELTRGRAIM